MDKTNISAPNPIAQIRPIRGYSLICHTPFRGTLDAFDVFVQRAAGEFVGWGGEAGGSVGENFACQLDGGVGLS